MEPPDEEASELHRHLAELVPSTGGAVGGALLGIGLGGAPGAVVGAAVGAVAEHVAREALTRRRQRAAEAVGIAAIEARLAPEELFERILADEQLLELAAAVIAAAAETALQAKIRALGEALARGTLASDDAVIDQERFMVGTLAVVEAPHLRVLHELRARDWSVEALHARLPGIGPVLAPVVGILRANALVYDITDGSMDYFGEGAARWALTDYGREVLDLLEEQGSEEPDTPAQDAPKG